MSARLPDEIRPVMESGIPIVLVTCSAAGEPNVAVVSQARRDGQPRPGRAGAARGAARTPAGGDPPAARAVLRAQRQPRLDAICDALLRAMDECFGFRHGLILLLEENGRTLSVAAARGYKRSCVGARVGVGTGVIGLAARERKVLRVGNLSRHRAYARDPDRDPAADPRPRGGSVRRGVRDAAPLRRARRGAGSHHRQPRGQRLITGENGTGKDLAAKVLHGVSDRAARPFMNITCSALPEALLESELFGHERGAFTDARQQKQGLLELADGGTVFLDEIGEMSLALQAKLLRFLEEKGLPARRRRPGPEGRRAGRGRDQPRAAARGQGGPLPRGPRARRPSSP